MADSFGDDAAVLDLLQRVLGVRGADDGERRGGERDAAQKRFLHGVLLRVESGGCSPTTTKF
jgi:hypothetical protein